MPRGEKKKKEKKKGETDLQKETGVCFKKSAKQDINKLDLWKQK